MLQELRVPKLPLALVFIGSKPAKDTVDVFAAIAIGVRGNIVTLCSSVVTSKGYVDHQRYLIHTDVGSVIGAAL